MSAARQYGYQKPNRKNEATDPPRMRASAVVRLNRKRRSKEAAFAAPMKMVAEL